MFRGFFKKEKVIKQFKHSKCFSGRTLSLRSEGKFFLLVRSLSSIYFWEDALGNRFEEKCHITAPSKTGLSSGIVNVLSDFLEMKRILLSKDIREGSLSTKRIQRGSRQETSERFCVSGCRSLQWDLPWQILRWNLSDNSVVRIEKPRTTSRIVTQQ